ncbi:DUF6735 family protein [Halorientalis salina]|uniref:DUF6735 family protein n=1 Tax=Halorientalis salina TaxID=2932266 RepID=UPI0010AD34D3|nr:DUF6735 family protein [Halorientalis salina]
MGHRALVAYERPDSLYNLHYSHWGGCNLRLKHAISRVTPFGGSPSADGTPDVLFDALTETYDDQTVSRLVGKATLSEAQIDHDPWATAITTEEIITEHLDYLHHEAFYIVDRDFEVTAYRTLWFGLQYDCETVTDASTVGNGALRTVRWYEGEPVGDGYALGEFRALKAVVGDMLDRGVFTSQEAIQYIEEKLATSVGNQQELIIRTTSETKTA